MADVAVSVAGAAIGFFIGGPTGAMWGWTVGSIVGGTLFGPRQRSVGPRLTDVKYSGQGYGTAVPIVFGAMPVTGKLIWCGTYHEIENKQKVGKRGSNIWYTARQSGAWLLCEGPIAGVRRIWLGPHLVYSRVQGDVLSEIVTGKFAEQMEIYLGTEDQEPDPVIQADVGVDSTPAYLGTAYVRLEELDLTTWGNVLPPLRAEVIESAAFASPVKLSELPLSGANGVLDGGTVLQSEFNSSQSISIIWRDATDASVVAWRHHTASFAPLIDSWPFPATCINDPRLWLMDMHDPDPPPMTSDSASRWLVVSILTDDETGAPLYSVQMTSFPNLYTYAIVDWFCRLGDFVYGVSRDGSSVGAPVLMKFAAPPGGVPAIVPTAAVPLASLSALSGTSGTAYVTTDGTHIYMGWSGFTGKAGYVWKFDADLNFLLEIQATRITAPFAVHDDTLLECTFMLDGAYVLTHSRINGDGSLTTLGTGAGDVSPALSVNMVPLGGGVVLAQDAEWSMTPSLAPGTRTLAQVCTAICSRVGLTDLDTSLITAIQVSGMRIDQRMPARSALESLLPAYAVDGVESAFAFKFVPRGGATAATISAADDMGATLGEAAQQAASWSVEREREGLMPQRVDVAYFALDSDYEPGAQTATRGQVFSAQQLTVEVPLALDAQQASRLAHRLLYESWASRSLRRFAVGPAYVALEPTDPILIAETDGATTRWRIVEKTEDDGVLNLVAASDDDGVLPQIAPGAPTAPPATLQPPAGSTDGFVFEAPPLADGDAYTLGVYAVGAPFGAGSWPGAGVWASQPAGIDFTLAEDLAAQAIVGSTNSALAAWDNTQGQARPDTVDVFAHGGTLANASIDDWLGGENLAIIGAELVRFRTVTALGGGEYRLSGLLRGQHGADHAAGGHGIGEPFALLLPAAARTLVPVSSAYVGAQRDFRIVTNGQSVPEALPQRHTVLGRTLKPLAPVHVTVVRQANGDRTFRWLRRARAFQDWRESADIPLIEAAEAYRYEIVSATTGAALRSGTVAAPSLTYTAAQIAADFGGLPPTHIRIRLWQQSDLIGDGEPADVTLQWAGNYNASYARNWDEYSGSGTAIAGMTGFGLTPQLISNSIVGWYPGGPATSQTALLRNFHGSTTDAKARFDAVPAFVNGLLRVRMQMVYDIFGTTTRRGLVARTSHWRNNTYGFGYAVEFLHGGTFSALRMVKGDNADSAGLTQIGSTINLGVASTDVVELVWLLNGSAHSVWVNGVKWIDALVDTTHLAAGQCGLYAYGGFQAGGNFDDFQVDYLS